MESKHEIPEVPDLYRLAFMPGVFKCLQCDFQLSKQTMNPSTGIIGVSESDRETEECPNDGTMMVPVTYREQLAAYESRLFQELDAKDALQSQLTEARSQIEALTKRAEFAERAKFGTPCRCESWIATCAELEEKVAALEAQLADYGKPVDERIKQAKLETAIALEVLTRIATADQIHKVTSDILASRTQSRQGA